MFHSGFSFALICFTAKIVKIITLIVKQNYLPKKTRGIANKTKINIVNEQRPKRKTPEYHPVLGNQSNINGKQQVHLIPFSKQVSIKTNLEWYYSCWCYVICKFLMFSTFIRSVWDKKTLDTEQWNENKCGSYCLPSKQDITSASWINDTVFVSSLLCTESAINVFCGNNHAADIRNNHVQF